MERVSKDKDSSLLGLIVSGEGKKFYNIDTWSTGKQVNRQSMIQVFTVNAQV